MQTKPLLTAMALLFSVATASAFVQLTWDPSQNGSGTAGSANWDTTATNTVWYNGSADVVWSQTSGTVPLNGATFNGPDAAPGTYVITLDATQVAPSNIFINNNGYIFTTPGTNDVFIPANSVLSVAANKTVTFNCPMGGSATQPAWELGSGATMNVGGSIINGQQLRFGGAAGSVFNLTGASSSIAIPWILGPAINVTAGSLTASGNFFIGFFNSSPANGSLGYSSGTLTVSGSGAVSDSGGIFIIARGGGQGTLVLQNGGTVNIGVSKAEPLAINYDGNAANVATVNVQGGTLQVGTSGFASQVLFFDAGAAAAGSTAILNQSGGTILAWGGIVLGNGGGVAGSVATLTNSGGALDVGPSGITKGGSYSGSFNITLSGGTVGDLATPGWSSSLPMTLGTANGNIAFSPNNTITLSGALTGSGGLFVNGGTLSLTGADNFSGSSTVSNGTLSVATASSPVSGALTLDASNGSPTVNVASTPGNSWSIGGALTFQNGTGTLGYQFGALPPSPSVAPLQVSSNVSFASTPNLSISGTEIAKGTYPLITYTGAVSGTLPTVTSWSGSATAGTVTNNTSTKTISLIVTASSVTAPLTWAVGNSTWDFISPNWKQNGGPADYIDGDAVIFDNTASGTSPITVTLNNTTVMPASVTFNNSSKSYIISNTGTGTITGSSVLSVLASGTNALAGYNTYSGGTVLSAGQLNINNGGDASGSAIGTGTLTINGGAMDNTSGSNVTLQPSIAENWNGNFAYIGSANSLNTGAGGVSLNQNVTINVMSNNLIVAGAISDSFHGLEVLKTGAGALTLNNSGNNYGGGLALLAGTINFGADAGGGGNFIINAPGGCSIDNTSGGPLALSQSSYTWTTGFEFIGSANLDLGLGTVTGNTDPLPPSVTVDGNSVISTEGQLNFGNVSINKYGTGTWNIGGTVGNSVGFFVYAGELQLNKNLAQAVNGHLGLNVYLGGLVIDSGVGSNYDYQIHSDTHGSPQTVTLQGGTWDLNGHRENVDIIAMSSSGTLENSAASSTASVLNIQGLTNTLSGLCYMKVDAPDGYLVMNGSMSGDGTETLVKTGAGTLEMNSNNVYTGGTVISNGTIALVTNGALSSSLINLAIATSALDLTSNNSTTLTLASGQTLSGFGIVTGLVTSVSGANIAPGSSSTIGTLTVTGFAGVNTLNGTTTMKLNKTGATNDVLAVGGSLVFGGTMSLTNLSGTLSNGDSFTLFNSSTASYSGSFASITPSTPGAGLSWDTSQLDTTGTIRVMTGSTLRPAVFTPILVSGSHLTLVGTNGTTNGTYKVLTTTNLSTPLTNWVQVGSGSFGPSGNFSFGVTNTNNQAQFYILKEP